MHIHPYTISFYVPDYTLYAYWQNSLTVGILLGILVSCYTRQRHITRSSTNDNKHLTEPPSPPSLINERQGFMSIPGNKGMVFQNQYYFKCYRQTAHLCMYLGIHLVTLSLTKQYRLEIKLAIKLKVRNKML